MQTSSATQTQNAGTAFSHTCIFLLNLRFVSFQNQWCGIAQSQTISEKIFIFVRRIWLKLSYSRHGPVFLRSHKCPPVLGFRYNRMHFSLPPHTGVWRLRSPFSLRRTGCCRPVQNTAQRKWRSRDSQQPSHILLFCRHRVQPRMYWKSRHLLPGSIS